MRKGRPPKWTKEMIINSFQEFINVNNRLPYQCEVDTIKGMPKRLTIKRVFDLSFDDFCKQYFTKYYELNKSNVYKNYSIADLIQNFKDQYVELNYPSMDYYNKHRAVNTPQTKTLCRILGVTYNELLIMCGFETKSSNAYSRRRNKTKHDFKVTISFTKCDFDVIEEVNKILNKK